MKCFCSLVFLLCLIEFQTVVASESMVRNYTVSLVTPASEEACSTLGVRRSAPVSWRYTDLAIYHGHTFQFPPARRDHFLCVPAKNGNHNWAGLFYRLWYGKAPRDFDAVRDIMLEYSVRNNYSRSRDKIWLVTRSPYVRLLSIYLEKIKCTKECHHSYNEGFAMYKSMGAISFPRFVEVLVTYITDGFDHAQIEDRVAHKYFSSASGSRARRTIANAPSSDSGKGSADTGGVDALMSLHSEQRQQQQRQQQLQLRQLKVEKDVTRIKPNKKYRELSRVERGARLCRLDHHLCVQSAALFKLKDGRVRVLRLEEQGSWFKQFTDCFGIQRDSIVGEDWTGFSKQPCFYTPNGDCNDALQVTQRQQLIKDGVHGKGSVDYVNEYYDTRTAMLVSYLFEYDLTTLGYAVWNGSAPFVNELLPLLTEEEKE